MLRQAFAIAVLFTVVNFAPLHAQTPHNEYTPKSGQPGKDIVWVPSPTVMVEKLLDMARVTPSDYVIDLGSGDGRNVIAAAKRGARAHGIEYDAELVEFSKRAAAKAGVADKATFEKADIFASDFSKATVIVLFLTPEMNIRLRPKLLALKPGARIVANTFAIGDWNADQSSRPWITASAGARAGCGSCRRESKAFGSSPKASSSSDKLIRHLPGR